MCLVAEGRKKSKDTKALGKKKRSASSEDDSRSVVAGSGQSAKNKKQKVNQEKESRKGQKVISFPFNKLHFICDCFLNLKDGDIRVYFCL